ncbi:MAG: hypothetical protein Q8P07_03760 [bacterium]|nr:hypothetical protein [bacterium]
MKIRLSFIIILVIILFFTVAALQYFDLLPKRCYTTFLSGVSLDGYNESAGESCFGVWQIWFWVKKAPISGI